MHELMFQAGVKGMSEQSELIPCNILYITRRELASLAPSFRVNNFVQNTCTSNNLQRLRTCTYAHAHIHSSRQATPPIDIEGCGLRDQRCCNVHPASFNQLAKETRYSHGSFARNSSRQKTPTPESPPSVKQSRTTSNPERCSFVAFEPPKVSPCGPPTCRSPFSSARF